MKFSLRLQKKWLILGLSCLLLPLYQNMTPFEEGEQVDIRDYAPRKPSGYLSNPMAAYVPHRLSGSNLDEIGESLLGHNFNPMLKETERLGISLLGRSDSYQMQGRSSYNFEEYHRDELRLDVVSLTSLRLSYHMGSRNGAGWNMVCLADSRSSGVNLQLNHPVSENMHLGISHQTEARSSQVQMGLAW